ncbi:IS110 family transposase [Streptosporangium sp. G11]|uniref:IS110 family transposase n=1 Tax=Streptosporangium sp. G11 TaxID=3436926 RepID=UPI003EBE3B6B
MRIVYERAAGLDVHLKTIQACVDLPDSAGNKDRAQSEREFTTFTDALEELARWLADQHVQVVAMEATGCYWKPIWYTLERHLPGVRLILVNPELVKRLPGRKTDRVDAAWLAELAACGLLRGSLVPDQHIRQLRNLTRYRRKLVKQRAAETQRVLNVLEDAGIKLGVVVSNILGVASRRMLAELIAGERDVEVLADLALGKMRAKIADLRRATTGHFTDHHAALLAAQLDHIDYLDALITGIESQVDELMAPFAETAAHLITIPGFGKRVIEVVIAQTTGDMSHFPSEHHLASWACMCPGNNQSGGKRKSGKTRKGNPVLREALVEAAWAATHTSTYHAALYRRMLRHLGNNPTGRKQAAVAVGHSLLCAAYHVVKNGVDYHDLGADYFSRHHDPDREAARLIKKIEKLTGKKVILDQTA